MAKKAKFVPGTAVNPEGTVPASEAVMIRTIHGDDVPESELIHIAPHLRTAAVRIDSLTRDPENARKHGKKDLGTTAASLKEFGQRAVLWFDPTSRTIKTGNGRHEAAQQILEWTWIAAMPWEGSVEQLRKFALVDNRTAELSEWDPERLAKELDAIRDLDTDLGEMPTISMDELGFGADDLADLEEDRTAKTKKKQTALEAKKAQSVEGQVFVVKITCGSERHQTQILQAITENDPKALLKLLNGVDVRAQAN